MAPLQHKVKACNTKLPPKQASILKQHKLETNIPIHKVQFDGVTKLDLKCYIRKTQGSVQSSTSQSPKHEQHRTKTQFSAGGGGGVNRGTKLEPAVFKSLQKMCSLAAKTLEREKKNTHTHTQKKKKQQHIYINI